jgi:hypothetical protein
MPKARASIRAFGSSYAVLSGVFWVLSAAVTANVASLALRLAAHELATFTTPGNPIRAR